MTICNKNVFTTKYAFNLANGSKYDEVIWQINTKLDATQKEKLTHTFDEILLECFFNAKECRARDDFIYEYDRSLGACYTFNSGNDSMQALKVSIRAGVEYGLTLVLYAHFYDRLAKDYNLYSGLIIKIGNSSYTTTSFGIEVASGFNTNILVERYFERTLPRPYSNCDIDNEGAQTETNGGKLIKINRKKIKSKSISIAIYVGVHVNFNVGCFLLLRVNSIRIVF